MRFADAHWLHLFWLLPVLVAFLVWAGRRQAAELERWCHPELQARMVPVTRLWSSRVRATLQLLALSLLILAVARPQLGSRVLNVKRSGIDVVVALDTSESMNAEDLKPNRITRARQEIQSLIDRLRGDRIGLVGFAGDAFVQCPVTLDYAAARMFLRFMDTDLIPVPGTAIARAIEVGTGAFDPEEDKFKALVLITDGEDHEGAMKEAAQKAKDAGVRIFAVGIGTEQGEPIPIRDARGEVQDYKRDASGEVILTQCNPAGLQTVCRETGGKYFDGQSGGLALDRLYAEIASLEEREMEGGLVTQYEDRFAYFAGIALLLLLVDGLLGNRRRHRLRSAELRAASWAVSIGASGLFPGVLSGLLSLKWMGPLLLSVSIVAPGQADEGSSLYEDGKYEQARDYYETYSREHPEDARAEFNLGTTLHRTQEMEPALEALQRSLRSEDPSLRAQALYNLGNTQVRAGDLAAAQQSYRSALRIDPTDHDSKFNLELVNRLLEQMPPDSTQQDQQQQNQDQNEQDQDEQQDENEQDNQDEQGENEQNQDQENQDQQDEQNQDQQQQDQQQNEQDPSEDQSESEQQSDEQEQDGNENDQQQNPSEEDPSEQGEQNQPQPVETKISPEEARRILEALAQQENNLQAERMKARVGKVQVEKDW